MTLIECPDCKKEISEGVPACPNCGFPLGFWIPTGKNPVGSAGALALTPMPDETPSTASPQRTQSKAVVAGWVCFAIGLVLVFVSPLAMLILYSPLFLAAFVLSIVGMAQGRIAGGLVLLLVSLVVPLVSVIGVSGYRVGQALHEQDVQKKTALSKLDFEDVKGYPGGEYMYVEGKIRNNGDTPVTYVKVRVEYLDKKGTIVDTDWTFARQQEPKTLTVTRRWSRKWGKGRRPFEVDAKGNGSF